MNGSDLARTSRQQELIAAMAHEVLSKNLLTDVGQLMRFLDAATRSLTVDPGLSHVTDMAGLALSLKGLTTDQIAFMTIPVATAPSDKYRVVWTSSAAKVWARMVADEPIVATETPAPDPTAGAASTATSGTTDATDVTATQAPAATVTPIPGVTAFTGTDGAGACG